MNAQLLYGKHSPAMAALGEHALLIAHTVVHNGCLGSGGDQLIKDLTEKLTRYHLLGNAGPAFEQAAQLGGQMLGLLGGQGEVISSAALAKPGPQIDSSADGSPVKSQKPKVMA